MRKMAAVFGLLGTAVLVLISILDHIIGFNSNVFYIFLILSCLFMAPMLIIQALALKDEAEKKKDKG